ncbi:PTS sugar transporter subunit IIB [Beduini massiliensis]|uniref:PTS sugar transporter subunit IIB n=1 Tax=Beduini massiliensis TaxID=1585974 RepID=UPI00059AB474|nr:PTS sugar transporter subunit IIB [Beduini massiliensis]
MMRIMLACAGGMSTSLLVTKMQEEAKKQGIECKIWAIGESGIENYLGDFDVLLLGPQIRYKLESVKKILNGKYPVEVIDMRNYGTMNGSAVFTAAVNLYNEFYQK